MSGTQHCGTERERFCVDPHRFSRDGDGQTQDGRDDESASGVYAELADIPSEYGDATSARAQERENDIQDCPN